MYLSSKNRANTGNITNSFLISISPYNKNCGPRKRVRSTEMKGDKKGKMDIKMVFEGH